jgi:TonB-linked SusC/RagA family outer membrane protein
MKLAPNAPALYDEAGNLNWEVLPTGAETWINPVRPVLRKYKVTNNNAVGNIDLSYRIWNTLTLKSTFGYTSLATDETLITPQIFYPPTTTANNRSAFYSSKKVSNWIIEPQLSYQLYKPYGKFDVLVGTTFQKNRFNLQAFSSSGYSNDGQLENITAATSVVAISALQETYNYNAVFGRLSYNFRDKYLLNLSLRRDGSSRFGSENLFNNFYGIGAGWVFTKEDWWSDRFSFLSFGKLKASYGTTGNDQIGNYSFMSLYRTVGVPQPYGGGTTLRANSLNNPYLQWEETRKFNAGINLGFMKDRILLNLNYYRNMSSNQLLGYNLPIITGFNSITENFDALVKNSGIELALNTENVKGKDFNWSTSLNITIPRNELVEFPGLATSSYATTLVIGEPLTITKAFKYAGVNPVTGRYNFEIPDKSLVEIPVLSRDETVTIDRTPKFYGGLQNSISYKGFSLDFLLQFTKQKGYDETRFGYSSPGTYSGTNGTSNQPVSVLNYWKQNGDDVPYQRPNPNVSALTNIYSYASSIYSDAAWTDASYIRLKNLSFSYTLPASLLKQARLQQVRLYAQGQNLLTFTKYKGLDPENQSTFVLPPLRVVTFGIQVSL